MSLRNKDFGLFASSTGGSGGGGTVTVVAACGCGGGIVVCGSPITAAGTLCIYNCNPYCGQAVEVLGAGCGSTVRCGAGNSASGAYSAALGGIGNTASGAYSTVLGGYLNTASATYSNVSGGVYNEAICTWSTIGGGGFNHAYACKSTIAGGTGNSVCGTGSTIGGGGANTASSYYTSISGGQYNTTSAPFSFIGAGSDSVASGTRSFIGAGAFNVASGNLSSISNGYSNVTSGVFSNISNGCVNTASGSYSFVGNGFCNSACGNFSAILGGCCNVASGLYSGAFGCNLAASCPKTFYTNNHCTCGYFYTSCIPNGCVVCSNNGQLVGFTAPSNPSYGLFAETGNSVPVTATTVEGTLIDSGQGTLSVPANGFSVGDSFTANFSGVMSAKNNDTLTIRVKSGSVILADSGPLTMPTVNNQVWSLMIDFTVRAIGGAGVASIVTLGQLHILKFASGSQEGYGFNTLNTTTFDTTVPNTLNVTAQWSSNSALNSIYSDIFVLTKIY